MHPSTSQAANDMATSVNDVIKGLPPASVGVLTLLGVPIEHWIQVLTLIWLVCLLVGWIFKSWQALKKVRRERRRYDRE